MQLGPGMKPWKTILAAEKTAYLAAGGNPVGVGKGRAILIVGILMKLSLAMCLKTSMHLDNPSNIEGRGPGSGCRPCIQTVQGGQGESEAPTYLAPRNCSKGKLSGHFL